MESKLIIYENLIQQLLCDTCKSVTFSSTINLQRQYNRDGDQGKRTTSISIGKYYARDSDESI
jgi:hypothetical protein